MVITSYKYFNTFIFYKACLLALSQYYIGFVSGFSGHQFFDDPIYQVYNLIFTAFPIMIIGIFERSLSRTTLENKSATTLYNTHKYTIFHDYKWYSWIIRAIIHSFLVVSITISSYGYNSQTLANGHDTGFYYISSLSFISISLIPTFLNYL